MLTTDNNLAWISSCAIDGVMHTAFYEENMGKKSAYLKPKVFKLILWEANGHVSDHKLATAVSR